MYYKTLQTSFVLIIVCVRIVILQHYPAQKEKNYEKKIPTPEFFMVHICAIPDTHIRTYSQSTIVQTIGLRSVHI